MKIYGAGLAGLLAGHMLRRYEPEIHEIQDSLPNNHESVLRFRSEAVSIATAIPFKKVQVLKQLVYNGDVQESTYVSPFLANLYSQKVTGAVFPRSIINLEPVERYIAPSDFIQQLSRGLNIIYQSELNHKKLTEEGDKISTIPMPMLNKLMAWQEQVEFKHREVWTIVCRITMPEIDVYQTAYFPGPELAFYRATLTGSRLILEYADGIYLKKKSDIQEAMVYFGIPAYACDMYQTHRMEYGKLLPVNEPSRQAIIRVATEKYNCYSLGRFGTWRQLLLDDVVNDVKVIERLMTSGPYARALAEK